MKAIMLSILEKHKRFLPCFDDPDFSRCKAGSHFSGILRNDKEFILSKGGG